MQQVAGLCGLRLEVRVAVAALLALAVAGLADPVQAGSARLTFTMMSSSMVPTVEAGDSFAASGLGGIETMRRGDVVVYRRDNTFYVGRIVGMPGETFRMVGGVPQINGHPFAQTEKEWMSVETAGEKLPMRVLEETTPEGKSYRVGMITAEMPFDDTGSVTIPAGHVVILGDNRRNSLDSRSPEVGPVSVATVARKAGFIFWSNTWSRIGSLVQ